MVRGKHEKKKANPFQEISWLSLLIGAIIDLFVGILVSIITRNT